MRFFEELKGVVFEWVIAPIICLFKNHDWSEPWQYILHSRVMQVKHCKRCGRQDEREIGFVASRDAGQEPIWMKHHW